jgi:hypothetical protein
MALEGRALLSVTTWTVDSLGDTGTGSGHSGDLRYCIAQADATPGQNSIVFSVSGTIGGADYELQNTSGDPNQTITIEGALKIDAGGAQATVVQVDPGARATLDDLIITDGLAGVENEGTLLMQSCTILDNALTGIANSSTLNMSNCVVSDTTGAINGGGGLYNEVHGTATLDNCTISNNSTRAQIGNDYLTTDGGGVLNRSVLSMTDCTISGNTANPSPAENNTASGGGLQNDGTATLTGCTISDNTVPYGYGGGVSNNKGDTLTMTNCTVAGNMAPGGGGMFLDEGGGTLINCTVSGNAAGPDGGSGLDTTGPISLINTIIAGNPGGDVVSPAPLPDANDHDLIGGDPLLAPLRHYGGATETMPLLPGSPAIGAGMTGGSIPTTDQRGYTRGNSVDIGAYQDQGFTLTAGAGSTPQAAQVGAAFGSPLALTVTANNTTEFTNPVAGGLVSFTDPTSGATASLSTTFRYINGGETVYYATANTVAGSYTVTASAAGASTPVRFSLTNTPGPATQLVITEEPSAAATAGQVFTTQPVVSEEDQYGNVETGDNSTAVTAELSTGSGPLLGTTQVTVAGGVATFTDLADASAETLTLGFTSGTLAGAIANPITVTTGTTTSVATSGSPAVFGQDVTFTATVAVTVPGAGTPSGTVTFLDGTTILGTVPLDGVSGDDQATFTTAALSVSGSPHAITAVYNGAPNDLGSSSNVVSQVVQSLTTTSLSASASAPVFGQAVTFTATVAAVSPGAGTPSGTVTFLDGTTILGTAPLSGVSGDDQATFTTALALGAHTITARYSGDTNDAASASGVGPASAQSVLPASGLAFPIGVAVDGAGDLFIADLGNNRVVKLTPSPSQTTVGSGLATPYGVAVDGSGDVYIAEYVNNQVVEVKPGGTQTTVAVASGLNSPTGVAVDGSGDVFIADAGNNRVVEVKRDGTQTNVGSGLNTPVGVAVDGTGDVFIADTNNNRVVEVKPDGTQTTVGSGLNGPYGVAVDGSGDVFIADTANLRVVEVKPGGTQTTVGSGFGDPLGVAVDGSGDVFITDSVNNRVVEVAAGIPVTVSQDQTTTALASSANPSVYGQAVTFMATVAAVSPGAGTPTGMVTFEDGTTVLGSAPLSGGVATLSVSTLAPGTHPITALYSGDPNDASSTSAVATQVVQSTTATVLAPGAFPDPSTYGQTVTFSATVFLTSIGTGTPTGTVDFFDGTTLLGSGTLNSNGTATLTTSNLAVGYHAITAQYLGDPNDAGSTSATQTQVVQYSTATALGSSPSPSTYGQAVTFTATVSPTSGTGTPTGTVEFFDGTTLLGSGTLNASGTATFATSSLAAGSHAIRAEYLGDANDAGSYSAAQTQVVNPTSTTTALGSSPSPSAYGQAVTFTATVTPTSGTATPTGTVQFCDGTTLLGSGTLNASGTATFTTSSLALGNHAITAKYSGDPNDLGSTSAPLTQTVQNSTTTALATKPNPTTYGQNVNFTATVTRSPGSGTPTGTVQFYDGTTLLGTANLNGGGTAKFATNKLAAGSHAITAQYLGDATDSGSTSAPLMQVVETSTKTVLSSSPSPSTYGQTATFTATVTPTSGSGTPTGTVQFYDGPTLLGSAALNASGTATFATSSLAVGNHPITAKYFGDTIDLASTAAPLTQTVQNSTTTALGSSLNPTPAGQNETFTATVTRSPGTGTPNGTVQFFDGTTLLGTANLNGSGTATFTTSNLAVGSHAITAQYLGDPNDAGSTSAPLAQVVQNSTKTVLASSPSPSTYGQTVTFSATVTQTSGTATPTGTVQFYDGTTLLGSGTLNASGTATFTTSSLAAGSHAISARYLGDPNDVGSTSATQTQVVQNTTTTALASSPNPTPAGQNVTFTATVTRSPGSGTPTGTVQFYDGTALLGTANLNGSGTATFATNKLAPGSHAITAQYLGDPNDAGSTSAPLTQVIQTSTKTVLTSSPSPSTYGQTATFTATVTPTSGSGTPTGTVQFYDGPTLLGTAALNAGGTATFATSSLAVGNQPITAQYLGDLNDVGSTSAPLTQTVQNSTTTALGSSLNPTPAGQNVTFTATVTRSPGTGTPNGTVQFYDGTTLLGTANLNGSGTATFATSNLAVGSHAITAQYLGDPNDAGSTSAPLTQVVQNSTKTVLASSPSPSTYGQTVTFSAAVTPTSGTATPTGTVQFYDGTTLLGSGTLNASGTATFTTSSLAVGSHAITAQYLGDPNDAGSTSAPLTQTVQNSTTTALASSLNPTPAGQNVTFTATVTRSPGSGTPNGTVQFYDGTTLLGTANLNGSGTATFATSNLAVGSHAITAQYLGDPNDAGSTSAPLAQVVQTSTNTVLTSSPSPSTYGQTVTFSAMVTPTSGTATPTGTVQFYDGTTLLGSGTLNASGAAAFATSSLAVGSHAITAQYLGDTIDLGSASQALAQVVNPTSTTTALGSSLNPSPVGQTVTFTATVAPTSGTGTPTGTVQFFDGTTLLGSGTLNASGAATFATSSLALGSHAITAQYLGDPNDLGSTSQALTQTVQNSTTTALASSQNPSVFGQPVNFTATVTSTSGTGTPTGTVQFFNGTTLLGSGTLNASGVATFATSSLAAGSHAITARYLGDPNDLGSASQALTQTVQNSTTTALASSLNPTVFGQPVTFTATVTSTSGPGAARPTGVVQFYDGTTLIGTAILAPTGTARFETSSLPVGSLAITAKYFGDTNDLGSTSGPLIQQVNL